jgi:hypothetical protein
MQNVAYLLPKHRHTTWHPALEPLALAAEPGVEIPLLGYVTAGQPVDIPEERETVTVPRHMVRKNSYALRVRGHSMIDDHIQDGDIIIVEQRETAENGESVVAMIGLDHNSAQARVRHSVMRLGEVGRIFEFSYPWKWKLTEGNRRCPKILPRQTLAQMRSGRHTAGPGRRAVRSRETPLAPGAGGTA